MSRWLQGLAAVENHPETDQDQPDGPGEEAQVDADQLQQPAGADQDQEDWPGELKALRRLVLLDLLLQEDGADDQHRNRPDHLADDEGGEADHPAKQEETADDDQDQAQDVGAVAVVCTLHDSYL